MSTEGEMFGAAVVAGQMARKMLTEGDAAEVLAAKCYLARVVQKGQVLSETAYREIQVPGEWVHREWIIEEGGMLE